MLFGLRLRQTTGFVASLLKLAGLNWPVPDYSTLCRRQKTLAVQLPDRGSGGPLHLLIDSTGIKVRGEGEWHARKHGAAKRRVWRKVHLAVDESTLKVRAVEFTDSTVGDAPILPALLSQIAADKPIASVTADSAYDGRACRNAIAERGTEALAIVLESMAHKTRRNAKPWKKDSSGAGARNKALRAIKRLDRRLWARVERLPPPQPGRDETRRDETKMNCIKLLGQKLAARDFDRQTAELQVRIAILNRFTSLGIPVTQPVG